MPNIQSRLAIGPVTQTGFFYDFDSPVTFTRDNFAKIAKGMRRIIKANLPIVREVVSKEFKIRVLYDAKRPEILQKSIIAGITPALTIGAGFCITWAGTLASRHRHPAS